MSENTFDDFEWYKNRKPTDYKPSNYKEIEAWIAEDEVEE